MKRFYNGLLCIVVLILSQANLSAQTTLVCNSETYVSLNAEGVAYVTADMITEGDIGGLNLEISRDAVNFVDTLYFNCTDIEQNITVTVRDVASGVSCWGDLIIEDKTPPTPYCINLSTVILENNAIEIYAIDINEESFDNCSIVAYTYGTFAFDFEEVTIGGILINNAIAYYFDEDGPIAALANAPANVVADYNAGLIQLWHPNLNSSSMVFLSNLPMLTLVVSMSVTDQSGNSDYCIVNLTLQGGGEFLEGVCVGATTVETGPWSCIVELTANDFVAASDFTNAKISMNEFSYTSTLDFDKGPGTYTLHVIYDDADGQYQCTTEVTVEDNISPVAVVEQGITIALSGDPATAILEVEDINDGSYDQCSDVSYELSQTIFTIDDIGENIVTLTVTDESGNSNQGMSTVTVWGEFLGGECVGPTTVKTDPWSCIVELTANDFVAASNFTNARISTNGFSYASTLNFDKGPGTHTLHVIYADADGQYQCTTEVTVEDNIPPLVVLELGFTIALSGTPATAVLEVEDVNNGSYDQCSGITMELSKTIFTIDDLGENTVIFTATDESGNFNQGYITINVIGSVCELPLNIAVSLPLKNIVIDDADQSSNEVQPDVLMEKYGFELAEVLPLWPAECETLTYVYNDITFNFGGRWKILRNFTVLNWKTEETITYAQIIKNGEINNSLACNSLSYILVGDAPVQLFAEDFVEGFSGPTNVLSLEITDSQNNVVVDNLVGSEHKGTTLNYTVTNNDTGESCFGNINVQSNGVGCDFNPDTDLSWPNDIVQIEDPVVGAGALSPEFLVSNYGFTLSEVKPVATGECKEFIFSSYSDDVFIVGENNSFKILRQWLVLDWSNGGVYEFIQVIKNVVSADQFICDKLSRSAPFGNCESGHTDDDDVEWPDDIEINDHRILPVELVSTSMIDARDAQPTYFNEPDRYTHAYVDQVKELTTNKLVLNRIWTVSRVDGSSLIWEYTQELTVNIENFDNLVTTTTMGGRAIPDVLINGDITTDDMGRASVESEDVSSLFREDEAITGVDIRDIVIMRELIVGVMPSTEFLLLAGDVDKSGGLVNTLDIIKVQRELLGFNNSFEGVWEFVENTDNNAGLQTKASYVGIKTGDLDDSFFAPAAELRDEDYSLEFEDVLLNTGEEYSVDVKFNIPTRIKGASLYYDIDTDILQIKEVTQEQNAHMTWYVNDDSKLVILFTSSAMIGSYNVNEGGNPFFTIKAKSKGNSILSDVFQMSESDRSVFIDINYDYIKLTSDPQGVISSTFDDPANSLSFVNVYPNPASDMVTFDFAKVDVRHTTIEMMDINGKLVKISNGTSTIDVSDLTNGMYIYKISDGSNVFLNKLFVMKD